MKYSKEKFSSHWMELLSQRTVSYLKIFTLKIQAQDTADKDGMFKLLSRCFTSPGF